MVEAIGLIGACMMMSCLVPQIRKTINDGHASSLSLAYLITAEIGMMLLLLYVLLTSRSLPLIANYSINGVGFAVLLKYKILPRK